MELKLLKNSNDFDDFCGIFLSDPYDRKPPPSKYPCYAFTQPIDWDNQLLEPVYLYEEDLLKMYNKLVQLD